MPELQEKRKYYLDRSLKAVYYTDEKGRKQGTYTEYKQNSNQVRRKIEYRDGQVWNGKVDTRNGYIIYKDGKKHITSNSKEYYYVLDKLIPNIGIEKDLPFVNYVETETIENGNSVKTKEFYYETYWDGFSPIPHRLKFSVSRKDEHKIRHQISYENGVRVDKIDSLSGFRMIAERRHDSHEWTCIFKNGELKEYSDRLGCHASFENGVPVGNYKMPLNKEAIPFYKYPCAIKTGEQVLDTISMPIIDGVEIFKFAEDKNLDNYPIQPIFVEGTWNDGIFTGEAKSENVKGNGNQFFAKWDNGKMTAHLSLYSSRQASEGGDDHFVCDWHDDVCDVKRYYDMRDDSRIRRMPDKSYDEKYTLKGGKLHGLYEKSYTYGGRETAEYKEGKLHGIKRKYNKAGWLESETEYKNGIRRGKTVYNSDGTVYYRSLNEVLKNVRKKIASKRIEEEKQIEAETGKKTILPKMSKGEKLVAMAKETIGLSK